MDEQPNSAIPATMSDIEAMTARIAELTNRVQLNEERTDAVPQSQIFAESAGNNIGKMVLDCAMLYGYSDANNCQIWSAGTPNPGTATFTVAVNDAGWTYNAGAVTLPPGRYVILANTDIYIDDSSAGFVAELLASARMFIYEDGTRDDATISTCSFWQSIDHNANVISDSAGDTHTGTLTHWTSAFHLGSNITTFKVANYTADTAVTFRTICGTITPASLEIDAAPIGKEPAMIHFKCAILAMG